MEEEEVVDIEVERAKCPWNVGDLVWARMSNFPFWPSIITLDPNTKKYFDAKRSRKGCSAITKLIHVRFCADKDRHSWLHVNNIFPFNGVDDFWKRYSEITPEVKKKDPKYVAAFIVKGPTKQLSWDDAVAEANGLAQKSIEERNKLFLPAVKIEVEEINAKEAEEKLKIQPKEGEEGVLKEKRKRKSNSTLDNYLIRKKPKVTENIKIENLKDEMDDEDMDDINEDDSESGENLTLGSPLTPPLSNKDSSDEIFNKSNLKKEKQEGYFQIFYQRSKDIVKEQDPDATDNQIKLYLLEMWDNMNEEDQLQYRADFMDEEELKLNMLNPEEEEKSMIKMEDVKTKRPRKSKLSLGKSTNDIYDFVETAYTESGLVKKGGKKTLKDNFELPAIIESLKKSRSYNLFRGMKPEKVCQICDKPNKLIKCKGPCHSSFHAACVHPGESSPEPSIAGDIPENESDSLSEETDDVEKKSKELQETSSIKSSNDPKEDSFDDQNFKCFDCLSGVAPRCYLCSEHGDERVRCSSLGCGKYYHTTCLKKWPQIQWQGGRLICPYHSCHTCMSDNPQYQRSNEKFVKCSKCPTAYHASITCLPAGSHIITGSQITCVKHQVYLPVNANWCFLCGNSGGTLVCCETCPSAFHLHCLDLDKAPEGDYICDDCDTGRFPLYREIVWVRLGNYRWWPAIIPHPYDIPANIAALTHNLGEFCVMFLGTKDYSWIHRGRAFLFEDGDATSSLKASGPKKDAYKKALGEAKIIFEFLQNEKEEAKLTSGALKPPPYKKIKVNKPVGNIKIPEPESLSHCDCTSDSENPCSPETDCLNRILMIECNPQVCKAGSKCQNQLFVQRKYPSLKPFHTEERGWGLKTLEKIKQGQFVIEYVGEIIDEAEFKRRLQRKKEQKSNNYYFLTIDNNRMIDAEPKGNLSRFMNHSCEPNCETQKWTVNGDTRIGLFALRDIEAEEEVNFNYNLACDGETKKPCLCKSSQCSGFIGLKLQKQSVNSILQKKNEKLEKTDKMERTEKMEKAKRGRRSRKVLMCWNCNSKIEKNHKYHQCDLKYCSKYYHDRCINIGDGISPTFHCPWHYCAVSDCDEDSKHQCSNCCIAYCKDHAYQLIKLSDSEYICSRHSNLMNNDVNEGEALMDASEDEIHDSLRVIEVQVNSFDDGEGYITYQNTNNNVCSTPKNEPPRSRNEENLTMEQIEQIIGM